MEIIRAEETWVERILSLDRECLSPPWTHGQMLSEIYNEDTCFLLAVQGDVLLGFAILRTMADEAELFRIAVDMSVRRRKIASGLLAGVTQSARRCDIERIFLEVRESNYAAIALYEKYGFTRVGLRRSYYEQPDEDALVMSLGVTNVNDSK